MNLITYTTSTPMDALLSRAYYRPDGFQRSATALASAAGSTVAEARNWLERQALWQIYRPAPRLVPRPTFGSIMTPNEVHQADILYMPKEGPFRYALVLVDVASRYKAALPLKNRAAESVAATLTRLMVSPLRWPKLLQVDKGTEFGGAVVSRLCAEHGTEIRRAEPGNHRSQAIVERANRTIAERLFPAQYAEELRTGSINRSWVAALPAVVTALNYETTRLLGMKPAEAITRSRVEVSGSTPMPASRLVGADEPRLRLAVDAVRYLYANGELEGGRRRATDPVWSLTTHKVREAVVKGGEPVVYHLDGDAPRRGFVREELQVVPPGTQLPPDYAPKPRVRLQARQASRTLRATCAMVLSRRSRVHCPSSSGA